ncbi:MAG: hypothetical protein PF489_05480, partial [Salinivirgaceae bacterium]|nr:hypothetical protein [Salinivirgaceae bacterium]
QKAASFTNFSFSGTSVDVRITTKFLAHSVTVRPLNYDIVPTKDANVFTFTLTKPKKISVEVNDRLNPLFILADAPDIPNTKATYYYGPGVHKVGMHKQINSNESVYIAGGAVVEGTFLIPDKATNIEFRGRGIISNGSLPVAEKQWAGKTPNDSVAKYSTFTNSNTGKYRETSYSNTNFEGFIIANGAGWTFGIASTDHASHHNTWRNIKLVEWTACTDGIWFDGDNNLIDDCFIFNNDDHVTSHGSNNCVVSNTVIWGGCVGGHLFSHFGYYSNSDNILYENINVIGIDGAREAITIMRPGKSSRIVQNITFRNIRIEAHPSYTGHMQGRFIAFDAKNVSVKNWLFENITIDDKNADEGNIFGTATSPVDGITFKNLKMGGKKIMSLKEANIKTNEFVKNVTFK